MASIRSFLIRGAAFLAFIGVLLLGINCITDLGLRRTAQDDYIVWNELLSGRASSDVIINGNSHAASQIDPQVIEKILGKQAYNIGLDGQDLDLQLMRYAVYRRHNRKPQIIIQVVDFNTLEESTRLLNRQQYLPYLQETEIYNKVHPLGISAWDRYLPLLKYRGVLPVIGLGMKAYFGMEHRQSARDRGFLPLHTSWSSSIDSFIANERYYFSATGYTPAIDDTARRFLARNRQEGIRTILVAAPQYYTYTAHFPNKRFYLACIAQEARKYGARFINFEEDELCFDKRNFSNATHLNASGAARFSQKLALAVRQELAAHPE